MVLIARLWSSGFELNSSTNGPEWGNQGSTKATYQTSVVRSGTYAIQVTSLSSGSRKGPVYNWVSANSTGPYYFRFYLRVATAPSAANTIFSLSDTFEGTLRVAIKLTSTSTLQLFDEDGQIGVDSSALSANTWYRVEVHYDFTGAAGSHVVDAQIDGSSFASASDRSVSIGVDTLQIGGNLAAEAQTTGNWYFDDIAINDSTGSFQNSYPGAGSIVHLRPNATGDNSGLGVIPSSTNWNLMDEVTPDNATTSLSTLMNSVNDTDDYNIDATPAAIDSAATINVVQVGVRFNGDSSSNNDSFVLRIKQAASGTVEESAAITPNSTTWITNSTAVPLNYKLTLYDLPGASTDVWTKALLDTAQIGARMSADDSFGAGLSTFWLLVDYTPTEAPATSIKDIIGGGIIPFPR